MSEDPVPSPLMAGPVVREPPTRSVRGLLASNYIGRAVSVAALAFFTPFLASMLGSEGYGLIGLYNVALASVALADFGLSAAANRELARLSSLPGTAQQMRDFVRTLESIYLGSAFILGTLLSMAAPLIGRHWLRPQSLTPDVITTSFRLMCIAVVLQFAGVIYTGALLGLSAHARVNALSAGAVILRQGGGVLVVAIGTGSVVNYLAWQILANLIWLLLSAFTLWRCLPMAASRAVFDWVALKRIWKYAAGLTGIGFIGLLLSQLDKFLLSKLLPLAEFGNYSIASALATAPTAVATPVGSAVFPRFVRLAEAGRVDAIASLYHRSAQLVCVSIVPATVVFGFFAREACTLWLGPSRASHVYLSASLLVSAAAIWALTIVPYSLQLAYAWPQLALKTNAVGLILFVPTLCALSYFYGALGAASASVVLATTAAAIQVYLMHKRLIANHLWTWIFSDVLPPVATAVLVASVARLLVPMAASRIGMAVELGLILTVATAAALVSVPHLWGGVRRGERTLCDADGKLL